MPAPAGAASPTPVIRPSDTSTSPGTSIPSTTAAATPSFIASSLRPVRGNGQYHFCPNCLETGCALRGRRTPKPEIGRRVDDVASLLGLEQLLDRRPAQLSGGQRQRVAMGRAIVRQPQAFLLDEPLSNLDAKLRVGMRASLAQLHHQLGVTTVYVTHDQTEAMTLGQRVAVMRDGRILQCDRPQQLYAEPANVFIAAFIGSPAMNLVEASYDGEALRFGQFRVPVAC